MNSNIAKDLAASLIKKVAETAIHALVFSAVSTKVSQYLKKDKDEDKVRVETDQALADK